MLSLKDGGKRVGCGFAFAAVLFCEQVQRGLKVERFAINREFQPSHRFVKQAVPSGGPDG